MRSDKGVFSAILASFTLFALVFIIIANHPAAFAQNVLAGRAAINIVSTSDPAIVTIEATFKAPQSSPNQYLLDTEVFDGNQRVAQWFETLTLDGEQNITRSYNWTIADLKATSYTFKQGVFSPDWTKLYSWNDQAGQFKPAETSKATNTGTVSYLRGVNLAGAEFGETQLPGVYGKDYIYPNAAELDYYHSKGLNLVRLPFRWERLQHQLFGNFDQEELARIDQVVAAVRERNMKVILEPHNYARYHLNEVDYLIGSAEVPTAAFQDFWAKLAAHYQGESSIYAFGLMNEPHDTDGSWKSIAQAGLDSIRQFDQTHLVLVPGDNWSDAWSWYQSNADLLLNDPANNLMYEAHQYFDRDNSGRYNETYENSGAYPTVGVDRVQPFVNWLKAKKVRGIITEYGVPGNDPRWQTVLDNFLSKLDQEGLGGTYWAGGSWWGNYALSCEPVGNQDAPAIAVLTRHLGK